MNDQEKTKDALLVELKELRQKYDAATERHKKEIAEIRQQEEEPKRNELFLKSALDNLPLIFYLIDTEGIFKLSAGSGLNSLGLKSHQVEGLSVYEIYRDYPVITDAIRKALDGENVYFESNVNGARHDNFLIPIQDSDHRLSAIAGIAFDVTRHKKTEEELIFSNELISLYIQNSPIYTFIKEVSRDESRVIMASENYREMIGIPGSEMKGKNMSELFPEEFAAKMTADDWDVVSKGKLLILDEDFNERYYTTIKFPIAYKGRNLLSGYTIDITERKQAEQQLKESEEKYKELVDSAYSIIIKLDRQGRITFFNEYAQKFFGYAEEEVLGKTPVETFVPSKDSMGKDLEEMLDQIFKDPDKFSENINENIKKNGERVWVAWQNKALRD